ncbi:MULTISPECIES: peptidoglycan D,D-transpeptidase FtsI family protein [Bacillus]|uniref:peptidoglycan D,D-transpeptidase FtsI family protein n=1 Tax=Bacillus TaxID=1386 RepID=UPI001FBBBB3E|nr:MULTISPECIES: penicillin-binding protein 2 [Bacillus]MCJ2147701.1 penicillin-binding protein 2 [Bacillus sp. B19-2]MDN5385830.1 penicillin-binding protein 2 [Bacillus sp. LB7]MEC1021934.1 penicillin-binding protein 2 [Bacillus paralicheniformis]MEC1025985.1 penicillin-binding protein 2 [Bacillus paralicheniformis]MEC1035338.1 penicillin-binding protein 2 [Bacillus paralicheniformis]
MMNKKMKTEKRKSLPIRLNILFLLAFIIFTIVVVRLGMVQIVFGEDYTNEVQKQEEVDVSTSVPRGKIYDRNLNTIVKNKPMNAITYTRTSSTSQEDRLKIAKKLAEMIEIDTDKITERDKKDYWILTRPKKAEKLITDQDRKKVKDGKLKEDDLYQLQLDRITEDKLNELTDQDLKVLAIKRQMDSGYALTPQYIKNKDVSAKEMAVVSEHLDELPGVDVTSDWKRDYPYNGLLRTMIGSISDSNEGLPKSLLDHYLSLGYNRNDRVGKSYLEAEYENVLQGQKEKVKNITNKSGDIVDKEVISEGKSGKDLVLTIDVDMQKAIEKIIEDELKSAKAQHSAPLLDRAFVVMMDPRNGEVLSIAGKQLKNESGKLKVDDYALGTMTSSYAMGSAVKGATVLTGLQTGAINLNTTFLDEPLWIGDSPNAKKSWRVGLGTLGIQGALEQSSNVFMFKTAIALGKGHYKAHQPLNLQTKAFDTFRYYFSQFGLGVKTGIDLPNEASGYKGSQRLPGFLLDYSIGQYDTYTPLQLAQYVSTIANGGYRMKPQLVKEIREPDSKKGIGAVTQSVQPEVLNKLDMSDQYIKEVQNGFRRVMTKGTAAGQFASASYKPAGKTGTAQSFYDGPDKSKTGTPTYNTTLVAYAPYDNPEVAISVVVPWVYNDYGQRYSITNEIGRKVLDKYFELKSKQSKENTAEKNKDKIEKEATE